MKKGFTLVEMVVVLTILALLTHLAVREAGSMRDEKLSAAANRQLGEIRDAVATFAADMGRLPRALNELWRIPEGAVGSRLIDACTVDRELPTNRVVIAAGWRGPYLRLPIGKRSLYDSWGNDFATEVSNGVIVAVGHYGANGRRDGEVRGYERDVWVRFDGADGGENLLDCSLSVSLDLAERENVPAVVRCKLFWPGERGLCESTNLYTGVMTVSGLTPGGKTLWESVSGAAHAIEVKPGANSRILKIR